jgi:hypothetical protein
MKISKFIKHIVFIVILTVILSYLENIFEAVTGDNISILINLFPMMSYVFWVIIDLSGGENEK